MAAFKQHIEAYINGQLEADPMFADIFNKSERTVDDCINYLLNWVKSSGSQIVAKEEIYGQIIHFYTENLEPGQRIDAHVVCATRAQLTDDDKRRAYQVALYQYQQEELAKLRANSNKPKPKATAPQAQAQATLSLFDD